MTIASQMTTVNLTAQNQFSDPISLREGQSAAISLEIGTLNSTTIVLQRRLSAAGNWNDVPQPNGTVGWTASTETDFIASASMEIRVGVKTGGFGTGAGSATIRKG